MSDLAADRGLGAGLEGKAATWFRTNGAAQEDSFGWARGRMILFESKVAGREG